MFCPKKFSVRDPVFFLCLLQLLPQSGILQEEYIHIQILQFFPPAQIRPGRLGLALQRTQLFFQLRQNVVDTYQVLLLVFQLCLSGRLPALEFHDSRRFVKKFSALLRFAAQDFVDLSLPDDGVALLTDTGIIEQFIYILQTAGTSVNQIFTFSGTVNTPCHRHLIKVNGKLMVRIVQCDGHIGVTQWLSVLCTRENDILHAGASQLLYTLLPQYPADSIRHIALSASVGSHDSGNPVVKLKIDLICKGFKTLYFNAF